ncbi:acyl-CoA synthetase FdrA [Hyphococcus sp.]|uniref:acyl-CoA synthetase FdrA n=1 Tax=Hyphococcus sp. TaxID=2038636 RepID=UPI003CCB80ED
MASRVTIRKGEYHDSVRLMQASQQVRRHPGVKEAILMMATDNNKKILAAAGMSDDAVANAARDDLVIAVMADDDKAAESALALADEVLAKGAAGGNRQEYRSLDAALKENAGANIALISVPGEYAVEEARNALDLGLNVMLFSDNVSIEDELALKQQARANGLLLMGPDCGTAIISGCGLGFANAVRRGNIGLIGASGTGLQEITTQIDRRGGGVSHAIGVGGRDAKSEIGGMSMLQALKMLAEDDATEVIVLTSKPPNPSVGKTVLTAAGQCKKPVIVNFLGMDRPSEVAENLTFTKTLCSAAIEAVVKAGVEIKTESNAAEDALFEIALGEIEKLAPVQKSLRGLYAGGTLCYEAMLTLQSQTTIYSNIATDPANLLSDPAHSRDNTLLDLGEDFFTQGRAHPMIDPEQRNQRLLQEAADESVAVILFDVVLGFGAHPDPSGDLCRTISKAREQAAAGDRHLIFVASICGTKQDPQDFERQLSQLAAAGVIVAASNAEAVAVAKRILQQIAPA